MLLSRRRRPGWLAVVVALLLAACSGAQETASDGADDGAATATGAATAAGAATTDGGEGADGDGAPIRIGTLTALSGPFAQFGVSAANGMQMAVAEINDDGGVDGRPLELVERDTQGDPQEAVTALRGMIDRDGVVAVGGVISSDVGAATATIAEAEQVPLLLVKAGADAVLTAESRYTFRTCLPAASMTMAPVAAYLEQENLTRAGAIVADYSWGRSIEAAFEEAVAGGGAETQIEVAPVSERDFTSYLRALRGLEPDVIVATGHPPGAGAITSQAAGLGIDTLVTGPWSAMATLMDEVGDTAFDRFVDFDCADYASESYQQLATRYHERFDTFMEDDAVAGYGIVTVVAEAVAEVGDDPIAVADHLRSSTFELPGYPGELSWTEWGELASATPVVSVMREQPPPDGVNPGANWYPEVLLISEPLDPHEPG